MAQKTHRQNNQVVRMKLDLDAWEKEAKESIQQSKDVCEANSGDELNWNEMCVDEQRILTLIAEVRRLAQFLIIKDELLMQIMMQAKEGLYVGDEENDH